MGLDMYLYRKTQMEEQDVAYWRKANAIHRWFVKNVQDGEDDCGKYHVTRKQLEELRDCCMKVIEQSTIEDEHPNPAGTIYHSDGRKEQHVIMGRVITNPDDCAAKLLPTQGGFFFGNTEYGEYYIQDLENTVLQLTKALAEEDDCDFYYHSSW